MRFRALFGAGVFALSALALTVGCLPKPDQGPPIVTIINPAPQEVVSGIIPIVVTAYDENDLKEITILINGVARTTIGDKIATYEWDTSLPEFTPNRDHHITAYGIDEDDNIGPSAITTVRVTTTTEDTLPPVVTLKNPVGGQTVTGVVPIFVEISDDSPINRVEFFIDGVLTFTDEGSDDHIFNWDTDALEPGSVHTIFARAYDAGGAAGTSPTITVTVAASSTTLNIALKNPVGGTTLSGVVPVFAEVNDPAITDRVEFFIDGSLVATDSDPDYIYNWTTTGLPANSVHTIFVRAFDLTGQAVTSPTITVTVTGSGPADAPLTVGGIDAGGVYSARLDDGLPLSVSAPAGGNVAAVEFIVDGELLQRVDQAPYRTYLDLARLADNRVHTVFVRMHYSDGRSDANLFPIRVMP